MLWYICNFIPHIAKALNLSVCSTFFQMHLIGLIVIIIMPLNLDFKELVTQCSCLGRISSITKISGYFLQLFLFKLRIYLTPYNNNLGINQIISTQRWISLASCWSFPSNPFVKPCFQLLSPSLRRRMLIKWNQHVRKYLAAVLLLQCWKYMEK